MQTAKRLLLELVIAYLVLFAFGVNFAQGSPEEVFRILLIAFPIFCVPFIPFRVYGLRKDKSLTINHIGCIVGIGFLCVIFAQIGLINVISWKYRSMITNTFNYLESVKKSVGLYHLDWGEYPTPQLTEEGGFLPPRLTTPIPYLDELPLDPYPHILGQSFGYWIASGTAGPIQLLVHSWAPDGFRNLPHDEILNATDSITRDWLYQFQYHPSNGIKSTGDFILWGGGDEEPGNFGP